MCLLTGGRLRKDKNTHVDTFSAIFFFFNLLHMFLGLILIKHNSFTVWHIEKSTFRRTGDRSVKTAMSRVFNKINNYLHSSCSQLTVSLMHFIYHLTKQIWATVHILHITLSMNCTINTNGNLKPHFSFLAKDYCICIAFYLTLSCINVHFKAKLE